MDDGPATDSGRVLPLPPAPDGIELRHLRAFVAVAEELNFGRAASRLYLSQPALSRQIRSLERHVGCDLLRRSTHGVELTVAGDALLDRARDLLHGVDDAVSATRAVGGEIAGRLARIWEPVSELATADTDLQELRNATETLHAQFAPPPETTVQPVNTGGVPSLLVTAGAAREATLLFLHGGGYVAGSAFGYRHLAGALAVAADCGVVVPEYRLAPEHPFPAAVEDALRAYVWMLDSGIRPDEVTLAGDSSGGGLALSLLIRLTQEGLPLPGGAVLLSPAVDLTFEQLEDLAGDPARALSLDQMRSFAASYLAGHPADDPLVNSLHADLTGLPPLLVQGGTGDLVVVDAHRLAARAREHGIDVRLELYPADTHDFQVFWSFLPEAADALKQAGRFAREVADAEAHRASS
ncbi:MAG TPA: alpha/beta hydrolase fold domain-containing protein [Acidimicrobiales bacterium]|nr:alpha/beta hydrolase fold domain-containing protein [Acidimicrobiales bacterium]